MLPDINFAADIVIWAGALWLVLTGKVVTRTFSCVAIGFIGLSSLLNLAHPNPDPSGPETLLRACVASLVAYCFYRLEVRHWLSKRLA